MNDLHPQLLATALEHLIALNQDGMSPADAERCIGPLRSAHPDCEFDLVWEHEPYDNSIHYDLLIRNGGDTTVSLAACTSNSLPWPLRGVRCWSDSNLLQVNGRMLTMEDAVGLADFLWNDSPIADRMVSMCLIRDELERQPIDITDDELQSEIDAIRRLHGLYSAQDTHSWLAQRGMTHEELEELALGNATLHQLKKRITGNEVKPYFEAHRPDFDTVSVALVTCRDGECAQTLKRDAANTPGGFWEAAQMNYLASPGSSSCSFHTYRRRDSPAALVASVFEAAPGDLVGPISSAGEHQIAYVMSHAPAQFDVRIEEMIQGLLFDEWLTTRRSRAAVTWHWGRPSSVDNTVASDASWVGETGAPSTHK